MVSATRAAHDIEITAESLQRDLARLEIQKRALERELAAVAAHLDSVQRALSALPVLMAEPSGRRPAAEAGEADAPRAAEQLEQASDTPATAPARTTRKQSAPRQKEHTRKEKPATRSRAEADEPRGYGALTEQILEY